MRRFEAIQLSWRQARVALPVLWDLAAERLGDALDSDLDYLALIRFGEVARRLSAAIGNHVPLLAGPGLTLYTAVKVADEVLRARDEMARRDEVMGALVRLDALDDEDVA